MFIWFHEFSFHWSSQHRFSVAGCATDSLVRFAPPFYIQRYKISYANRPSRLFT